MAKISSFENYGSTSTDRAKVSAPQARVTGQLQMYTERFRPAKTGDRVAAEARQDLNVEYGYKQIAVNAGVQIASALVTKKIEEHKEAK